MSRDDNRDRRSAENLTPISPESAVQWYLRKRRLDLADSSLYTHESSLRHFIEWTNIVDLDNMNDLNGTKINEYIEWRTSEAPSSVEHLAPKSQKTQIDITRKFIECCEGREAVSEGLSGHILSFQINKADEVRDEFLSMDRINNITDYLGQYHYASRDHVVWVILREAGPRLGGLRALDVCDINRDPPSITFVPRPESGTPLKNGDCSERMVAILDKKSLAVIEDYIEATRKEVLDEYDREPLFTTRSGRIGKSTLRKIVYKWSCPNSTGGDCDHDETMTPSSATRCSNNAYPHMVRRGVITNFLRNRQPMERVSDRFDVGVAVIKKHYDGRNEKERMETRRDVFLNNFRQDSDNEDAE